MNVVFTLPCLVAVLAVCYFALRRAWMSRSQNWILYATASGAAANGALALVLYIDHMPPAAPLLIALTAVLGWRLLRQYCSHLRAVRLHDYGHAVY